MTQHRHTVENATVKDEATRSNKKNKATAEPNTTIARP